MCQSSKPSSVRVPDGGALLHQVHREKRMRFSKIADEYIKYMRNSCCSVIVIFDGYDKTTSVKSHEHTRKSLSKVYSRDIVMKVENPISYSKDHFLSNAKSKSQLIRLLAESTAKDGQKVYVCVGDTNSKIVEVGEAKSAEVIVIVHDSDVPIMLLYH